MNTKRKALIKLALSAQLMLASFALTAQQAYWEPSTTLPFCAETGGFPGEYDNVYKFTGDHRGLGDVNIYWVKHDEYGTPLPNPTYIGHLTNLSAPYNFNVKTDGTDLKFYHIPDHNSSYHKKTISYPEAGNYSLRAVFTPSGVEWGLTGSVPLVIDHGAYPEISINGQIEAPFVALEDCNQGQVLLSNVSDCRGDEMHLTIYEINPFTQTTTGNSYGRYLNGSEVSQLNSGGLDIRDYHDPGNPQNGIQMVTGKSYRVELTYAEFGEWKPSYADLQFKEGDYDLQMRDNLSLDNGFEPWSNSSMDIYESPDLWNRISSPALIGDPHENPAYNGGNPNKLQTRVKNVGCVASPAGVDLRLFWTRARMGELWDQHWVYSFTNTFSSAQSTQNNPILAIGGSEITILNPTPSNPYNSSSLPFQLPSIQPGQTWTMTYAQAVEWYPPNPIHYNAQNGQMSQQQQRPIICLLARINEPTSTDDPIIWEPTGTSDKITPYVRNNNNVVTRNSMLYDDPNYIVDQGSGVWDYGYTTVRLDNTTETPQTVTVCLDLIVDPSTNETFSDYGVVELATTTGVYNQWVQGGSNAGGFVAQSPTVFEFTGSTHGCISNIEVTSGADEMLGLRFQANGQNFPTEDLRFTYELSMMYADGSMGSSVLNYVGMPATPPVMGGSQKRQEQKGVESSGVSVFPNPASERLTIRFDNSEENLDPSYSLEILSLSGQVVIRKDHLLKGQNQSLDISDLAPGSYIVQLKDKESAKALNFIKE